MWRIYIGKQIRARSEYNLLNIAFFNKARSACLMRFERSSKRKDKITPQNVTWNYREGEKKRNFNSNVNDRNFPAVILERVFSWYFTLLMPSKCIYLRYNHTTYMKSRVSWRKMLPTYASANSYLDGNARRALTREISHLHPRLYETAPALFLARTRVLAHKYANNRRAT